MGKGAISEKPYIAVMLNSITEFRLENWTLICEQYFKNYYIIHSRIIRGICIKLNFKIIELKITMNVRYDTIFGLALWEYWFNFFCEESKFFSKWCNHCPISIQRNLFIVLIMGNIIMITRQPYTDWMPIYFCLLIYNVIPTIYQ